MIPFLKRKMQTQPIKPPLSLSQRSAFHLEPLIGLQNAIINDQGPDQMEVTVHGFTFLLNSEEDAFILKEIFNDFCYGLALPAGNRYVLVDIGMNIGLAAAYFSTIPQVEKIYGFEPFEPTYNQLMQNLERNNLLQKCEVKKLALGADDRHEKWNYSKNFKASSGIKELIGFKKEMSPVLEQLPVEIADAATALAHITNRHPDKKMIVKMDCEGGEYEILERLNQTGQIESISILMMEWHNALQPDLLKYFPGFHCFFYKNSPLTGVIYAVNQR